MLDKRVAVFHGLEMRDIEVERDGGGHRGELRSWHQGDDGWDAMVQYNVGPGMTYLERVAPERVRPA